MLGQGQGDVAVGQDADRLAVVEDRHGAAVGVAEDQDGLEHRAEGASRSAGFGVITSAAVERRVGDWRQASDGDLREVLGLRVSLSSWTVQVPDRTDRVRTRVRST